MIRIGKWAAVVITATVGVTVLPAAARANDGYLKAYQDINFNNYTYARPAAWGGNSTDWRDRGIRNQASSIWNDGWLGPLVDVLLYWGIGWGGVLLPAERRLAAEHDTRPLPLQRRWRGRASATSVMQGGRECLGQGHGRAADQAAQVAGVGVHLAAVHTAVSVSEDLRQLGG